MNPVGKALWYIDSHFAGAITLEEIAKVSGVSRFYLSRAFGGATGRSVMRYVRGRRLTDAARSLSARYPVGRTRGGLRVSRGVHTGISRPIRAHPETVRAQCHLGNLELVEPIKMDETLIADLEPPRFESGKPLLLAGLGERPRLRNT